MSKFKKIDEQNDIHTAYAKLYKISEKHEKLYRLASKKLSDVELNREELSNKVDEANQTIGALRTIPWLKRPRSLKQNCHMLELNWGGLLVQSLMKCLAFRSLPLIEPAWGMISLLLILLLLALLCMSHLLIMLILRTMITKLIQLVRT